MVPALVGRLALGDPRHRGHHLDRVDRVLADRGLLREHHRVGAVEDRVGHVGDLGARRARGVDHRVEHLRRRDRRTRERAGDLEQLLLDHRHRSMGSSMPRSPRATITQSETLRIASARSTACGFSILAISGVRVCSRTNVTSSGWRTKRQRDEVDADLRADAQVLEVLLGDGGEVGRLARDVEPLARGDRAADLDLGVDLALGHAHGGHTQADRAVGEVHDLAGRDRGREPGPGDRHLARVAVLAVAVAAHERHAVADAEVGGAVAQRADAQLGARAGPAGWPPDARPGRPPRGRAGPSRRAARPCRG